MSNLLTDAIGGYFPLETGLTNQTLYADAQYFSSARSAFYALLKKGRPSAVWMPRWICNAMVSPAEALGIPVRFYSLDNVLAPTEDLQPQSNDWLLAVNYFGLGDSMAPQLLARFNPQQIVWDHSQAFFSPPPAGLATIYSPRKFFGVPDGGILVGSIKVDVPPEDTVNSLRRTSHLLLRLAQNAEAGYLAYQQAESTLEMLPGEGMSMLTHRLLGGIDYQTCEQRRLENYRYLYRRLAKINQLNLPVQPTSGPLCYPLLINDESLRDRLRQCRIFVPVYWQDALERVIAGTVEHCFIKCLLPLPIDHRYGLNEMKALVDNLFTYLSYMGKECNEKN